MPPTLPPVSRQQFAWLGGLLVAWLILLAAIAAGATLPFDVASLQWLHGALHPKHLDRWAAAFTRSGAIMIVGPTTAVAIIYLLARRRRRDAMFLAVAVFGAAGLTQAVKHLVMRPRPALWQPAVVETSMSFPSAHSAQSMAFALAVILTIRPHRCKPIAIAVLIAWTLSIGLSRLVLGVHYPSDVAGGWLLAMAWITAIHPGFSKR